ncbi:MAG TPA: peptidylprolyl isomerase [Guyparkeria sp.]|nr:peptidylprolyl isomerase [Guyparkeria sp.]
MTDLKRQLSRWLLAAALLVTGPATLAGTLVQIETSHGPIQIELFDQQAPGTVENFLAYVRDGFYEGTIFHRVIPDFVAQAGGFTADFVRKDTRPPVKNEADNNLSNDRGTLAMARTADPDSATSQFFINLTDNTFLDRRDNSRAGAGYTVFGRVVEGMDTVENITTIQTGAAGPFGQDVPVETVQIESMQIVPPID